VEGEGVAVLTLGEDIAIGLVQQPWRECRCVGGLREFADLLDQQSALGRDFFVFEIEEECAALRELGFVGSSGLVELNRQVAVLRFPCQDMVAQWHEAGRPQRREVGGAVAPDVGFDFLRPGVGFGVGDGEGAQLRDKSGAEAADVRRIAFPDFCRGNAVGQLEFVRGRVMDQHGHADIGLVHAVSQAFEKGVLVEETRVHFAQGAKHAALPRIGRIALARAGVVAVEFIGQAAAVTVV